MTDNDLTPGEWMLGMESAHDGEYPTEGQQWDGTIIAVQPDAAYPADLYEVLARVDREPDARMMARAKDLHAALRHLVNVLHWHEPEQRYHAPYWFDQAAMNAIKDVLTKLEEPDSQPIPR
jgi:hypothetical protein